MINNPLWYPYSQMLTSPNPIKIISASGCTLITQENKELIDGISSWWSCIHGYNNPEINMTIKSQMNKVAHIMLGGLTHEPAIKFAEKLIKITPKNLNHVFFGDSGSVGIEIALKMAIQYWMNKNKPMKNKFIAFKSSYHGDTTGAMSVCDPVEGMHNLFKHILKKNYFCDSPPSLDKTESEIEISLNKIKNLMIKNNTKIAGLIIEPIMQAAGGFNFYSSLFLKKVKQLCQEFEILFIADEVATGFGRTGSLFACDHTNIYPDIMVLGKALTAGYIGHSATLTTTPIFKAFLAENPNKAFMHGPTFMGNPLACSIGLKSIEIFQKNNYLKKIKNIETILKNELLTFSHPHIKNIRVLGATAVIEVKKSEYLEGFNNFTLKEGVWLRPFNNYLYTMPPYTISPNELKKIIKTMKKWFH